MIVVAGITGLVVSGANLHDPAIQSRAMAHVGLAAVFTLIFGILAVAGEYRHGTITDTFLSFPGRGRVIAAKLTVYGLARRGRRAYLVRRRPCRHRRRLVGVRGGAFRSCRRPSHTRRPSRAGRAAAPSRLIGVGLGALIRNVAGVPPWRWPGSR